MISRRVRTVIFISLRNSSALRWPLKFVQYIRTLEAAERPSENASMKRRGRTSAKWGESREETYEACARPDLPQSNTFSYTKNGKPASSAFAICEQGRGGMI